MRLLARAFFLIALGALVAACGADDVSTVDSAAEAGPSMDCPDRPRPAAPEVGFGHADYFPPYGSLDDLTGASELVVLGAVTKLGRGEISGAQPAHGGFQALTVTLSVIETYRGDPLGDEIAYDESGWSLGPPEQPYEQATTEADVHRAQVGDCGFYFLTRSGDGENSAFRLTSIQGKFIAEDEDGLFAGYERSDPLSTELAAMSFTEFRDAVRAASAQTEGTRPRDVECGQEGPRPRDCGPLEDGGPERAAKALYEAWKSGDRDQAAAAASPAAIDGLWKQTWEAPGYEFSVCVVVRGEKLCEFTRERGSYIQMSIDGDRASGWKVTRASHLD